MKNTLIAAALASGTSLQCGPQLVADPPIRFTHFHPECAREGGHWNPGDDFCERCGLDLHAITEDHCSCEKCCGDIGSDDWEAARIYFGLDGSFLYSNTQMREYIAAHQKAED